MTSVPLSNFTTTLHVEPGFCRIYFFRRVDGKRKVYCLQETSQDNYEFLVCSSDGEPSHPVAVDYSALPLPVGKDALATSVRKFIQDKIKEARNGL